MVCLKDEINKILYNMLFSDIREKKYINNDEVLNSFSKKRPITITRKSNLVVGNENKELINNEIIKIFPIDEHVMYEVLISLSEMKDKTPNLIDTFYFLLLVTPENKVLNCDFFDSTELKGNNSVEDGNYIKNVLEKAKGEFENIKDVMALENFIENVRKER